MMLSEVAEALTALLPYTTKRAATVAIAAHREGLEDAAVQNALVRAAVNLAGAAGESFRNDLPIHEPWLAMQRAAVDAAWAIIYALDGDEAEVRLLVHSVVEKARRAEDPYPACPGWYPNMIGQLETRLAELGM
jgi:hypothetical protein